MIQGLEVNTSIVNTGFSCWWTRTPSDNSDYQTTTLGVRPACLL